MEASLVIIFVGALVLLAHAFAAVFERTGLPDVLFLIAIGIVIGPILHIVSPADFGKVGYVFTVIVLVVILFEGGLELSLDSLKGSFRQTISVIFTSYLISFLLLALTIIILTDLSFIISLFTAAVLAGPAPSVVIPLMKHLQLKKSSRTILTLESALGEALCILIAFGIYNWIKLSEVHVGHMLGALISSLLLAAVIGVIGGYAWSLLLNQVRRLQNAMFMTPAVLFIIFGICEFLGYGGPIAALTFGITIGNVAHIKLPDMPSRMKLTPIHLNEAEKVFLGEIVFLFKTFFFVYLGLSVEMKSLNIAYIVLAITGILFFARMIAIRASVGRTHTPATDASLMAAMIPKGLAAAVLATLLIQDGIEGGEFVQNLIYGVIMVSILASSGLLFFIPRRGIANLYGFVFRGYRDCKTEIEVAVPNVASGQTDLQP